jgi:hypothetical protein
MPISATSAKGVINIAMELVGGEQILLPTTAIISTITGFTAPTGSSGMRLHIKIVGWTVSGSLTITGVGLPGNTETVNVAAPTAQQVQSAQLASYEYVSVNAYSAITNVTTTGMTGGVITVWGIQAGKWQVPSVMKSKRVPKTYSPNEHNAFIERDKKLLHLTNNSTIDELKQDVYSDISLWWPYMAMGAPATVASIPVAPTVLLAPATLSASQPLTTQPTAPGMKLIITISAYTVAGTLTVNGTSYGIATSETIAVTAAGVYYTTNVYSAVTTVTNATTAATMGVTGVFGWSLTFLSGANVYSAAIEWFDGVGSWTHPFSFMEEADFDIKVHTEASITMKGKAQDILPIGDRTTVPLTGVNRITSLGANLTDTPIVGWQTAVYLDAITGTPLTTSYGAVEELKVSLKIPQEEHWTFNNSQNYSRVYAMKRECTCEATIDLTDLLQWEQFRQNLKQYLAFQFIGAPIGSVAGVPFFKSWTWTLPIKTDGDFDPTSDPAKGNVYAKAKWRTEYDPVLGGAYRLVVITQLPPIYAL